MNEVKDEEYFRRLKLSTLFSHVCGGIYLSLLHKAIRFKH